MWRQREQQNQRDAEDEHLRKRDREAGDLAPRLGNLQRAVGDRCPGNDFGSAPKTNCPPFSRKSETPMAVISTVSFGRSRSGR